LEGRDAEEMEALQARGNAEEVRTMRMTWADQMRLEGRQQGREQGREQGIRQTLLRQLGKRFGPLPEETRQRLEAIRSEERLNEIADQILVARSLEEMGLR
jgi:predicted transposase YdaD